MLVASAWPPVPFVEIFAGDHRGAVDMQEQIESREVGYRYGIATRWFHAGCIIQLLNVRVLEEPAASKRIACRHISGATPRLIEQRIHSGATVKYRGVEECTHLAERRQCNQTFSHPAGLGMAL